MGYWVINIKQSVGPDLVLCLNYLKKIADLPANKSSETHIDTSRMKIEYLIQEV